LRSTCCNQICFLQFTFLLQSNLFSSIYKICNQIWTQLTLHWENIAFSNCLSLLSFCYSFPVFTIVVLSSRFILDLGEFIYINKISFHP
jgi:hypothetical protein